MNQDELIFENQCFRDLVTSKFLSLEKHPSFEDVSKPETKQRRNESILLNLIFCWESDDRRVVDINWKTITFNFVNKNYNIFYEWAMNYIEHNLMVLEEDNNLHQQPLKVM